MHSEFCISISIDSSSSTKVSATTQVTGCSSRLRHDYKCAFDPQTFLFAWVVMKGVEVVEVGMEVRCGMVW